MASDSFSPLGVEETLTKAIDALKTKLSPDKEISVSGESMKVSELVEELDDIQSYYAGVRELRAQIAERVRQRRARHASVTKVLQGLRASLVSIFGLDSPELEQCGFPPRKK